MRKLGAIFCVLVLVLAALAQTHTFAALDTNNAFTGSNSFSSTVTISGTAGLSVGSPWFFLDGTANSINLKNTGVFGWPNSAFANSTLDTGFSRCGVAIVCLGNGTQGDKAGKLQLTNLDLISDSSVLKFGTASLTGFSRGSSNGIVALGNGTAGDSTGTLSLANIKTGAGTSLAIPSTGAAVVSDSATQTLTGKTLASTLNGFTCVANCIGEVVAKDDLTAQAANVGSRTLLAVPSSGAGTYILTCYAVVTQQATTSSTLPNVFFTFTDNDSNTVQTDVTCSFNSSGGSNPANPAVGFTSLSTSLNQAAAQLPSAHMQVNVRPSTNITWRTNNYASVGGTAMQYAVHVKAFYLGN